MVISTLQDPAGFMREQVGMQSWDPEIKRLLHDRSLAIPLAGAHFPIPNWSLHWSDIMEMAQ